MYRNCSEWQQWDPVIKTMEIRPPAATGAWPPGVRGAPHVARDRIDPGQGMWQTLADGGLLVFPFTVCNTVRPGTHAMNELLLDARRVLTLMWVAIKYGIWPIVRQALGRRGVPEGYAARFRRGMEELGITYLKLGQYLALRHDVLPPELTDELNKLFEKVPPMPFDAAKNVVEAELGGPLHEFFLVFEEAPVAAASIAQVHEARTRANDRVAVKVQRPGIDRIFNSDMRILRRVTWLVDRLGLLGRLSTTEMADEFTRWTRREMNFLVEGRTADYVRQHAAYEVIPRVFWELTTAKVLTTEFIEGISLAQLGNLYDEGGIRLIHKYLPQLELNQTLHNFAFASLYQIFVSGLFHGDPHPGNILVRGVSTIAFIDFGIFGTLTSQQRRNASGLVENLSIGNIDQSFRYYARQLTATEDTDPPSFEREAKAVLREWYQATSEDNSSVQERHLGRYVGAMIGVSRRNGLRMGMSYLLFWRTLNALDATALRFPEHFDLMKELRAFFAETTPSPWQRAVSMLTNSDRIGDWLELASKLPDQAVGSWSDLASGYRAAPLIISRASVRSRGSGASIKWLAVALLLLSLTAMVLLIRMGT